MGDKLQLPEEVKSPGFAPVLENGAVIVSGELPLLVSTVVCVDVQVTGVVGANTPKSCEGGTSVIPGTPPLPVNGT